MVGPFNYGKAVTVPQIKDVEYSDDNSIEDGIAPCTPPNHHKCHENRQALIFEMFYPTCSGVPVASLIPAFIFFHPGGFQECSSYTVQNNRIFCQQMAMRGFASFNCEYRRGIRKDLLDPFLYKTVQQQAGAYRASQDIRGAIRSIIKTIQSDSYFPPVYIDINNIFVGGFSAGAVGVLNAAYYETQTMVNQAYPSFTDGVTYKSYQQLMGDIEADYYVKPLDSNYRNYIKGIMCGWGGTPVPLTYPDVETQKNFFNPNGIYNLRPIICFHGDKDDVFPISPGYYPTTLNNQWEFFDGDPEYNYTDKCFENSGTLDLEDDETEEDIVNASSKNIYEIVKSFGKHAELYVDCQMRHGLDAGAANYQSDFGTGFTNDTDVLGYMAGRTATFFQAVMHPSIVTPVSLANTLFIECINSRKQCNVPNSPCPGQHVSCVIID